MDSLMCIVDTATFVEHIQEIKKCFYGGQMRLLVPQCTATPLLQVYEKTQEDSKKKPLRQPEPQRPRSGGRPIRNEPPAFDINPLVAGEFLSRLRSGKDEATVDFQKENEQYSPWKVLEIDEESKGSTDKRPSTFAQAVQKQNIGNMTNGSGSSNGLGKPRLVARAAGNETSPWKTGSKALSLPISEIPKDKRPLLSFALWRLHEKGASRWDTERTAVLCDDEYTNTLAKRLGIVTKTFKELSNYIELRKQAKVDREISGDLEADFGVQNLVAHQMKSRDERDKYETKMSDTQSEIAQDTQEEAREAAPQHEAETGIHSKTESSPNASTKAASVTLLDEQNTKITAAASDMKPIETVTDIAQSLKSKSDMPASKSSSIRKDIANPPEAAGLSNTLPVTDTLAETTEKMAQQSQDKRSSADFIAREKENDIAAWVRSLTMEPQDHDNFDPAKPEPPNLSNTANGLPQEEPVKVFKPLSYRQAVTGKADPPAPKQLSPPFHLAMSSPSHSPRDSPSRVASPQKAEMPQDVEDSDEEVVVFSPKAKRLSAQKPQRPQTPNVPPRVSHSRNASAHRPQSRSVNQRQQQPPPGPPPPIIDPDSFGRDLVTHPQPNVPRTFSPYGANGRVGNPRHNHHRNHHPRSTGQYAPQKTNVVAHTNAPKQNAKASPEVATVQIASHSTPLDQQEFVTPPQPVNGVSSESSFLPPTAPRSNDSPRVNGTAMRPERPRYSPRGSPRRGLATPEPEVGYILKSGATREATRGKGKLWIP